MSVFSNLPPGPFDVVLADPPWAYTGQQDKWGAAAKFYQTHSMENLCKLPVPRILSPNGVVFLWVTCPLHHLGIDLLRAWGLHPRGVAFVWVKTRKDGKPIGAQGVRPSIVKPLTEMVLVGSRIAKGRPMKLSDESVEQTVFAPRQEHSRKPDEVLDRVERLYPNARRVELFARRTREGWTSWGDQVPS